MPHVLAQSDPRSPQPKRHLLRAIVRQQMRRFQRGVQLPRVRLGLHDIDRLAQSQQRRKHVGGRKVRDGTNALVCAWRCGAGTGWRRSCQNIVAIKNMHIMISMETLTSRFSQNILHILDLPLVLICNQFLVNPNDADKKSCPAYLSALLSPRSPSPSLSPSLLSPNLSVQMPQQHPQSPTTIRTQVDRRNQRAHRIA